MDPLVLVTLVLGATVLLAFYITNVFRNKVADTEDKDEEISKAGDNITPVAQGAGKGKKKAFDKKQKEKGSNFQHPWLLSTLKGHSGRVLGIYCLNI